MPISTRKVVRIIFKKLIVILIACNVLILTVVAKPLQADAAYSKVATATAKKIAKELIQDSAVNLAEEIIFNYQMNELLNEKYDVDDGYKGACLDNSTECKKPVQVKENLSDTDKKNLGGKVEEVLDRKAGVTGWLKWLDWIVPIFLVGATIKWIETALDPDTEDLFDQVAKESLEELGLIKPVNPVDEYELRDPEGNPLPPPSYEQTETTTNNVIFSDFQFSREIIFNSTNSSQSKYTLTGTPKLPSSLIGFHLQRDISTNDPAYNSSYLNINYLNLPTATNKDIELKQSGSNLQLIVNNAFNSTNTNSTYVRHYAYYKLNGIRQSEVIIYPQNYFTINNLDLDEITDVRLLPTVINPFDRASNYIDSTKYVYYTSILELITANDKYQFFVSHGNSSSANLNIYKDIVVSEIHTTNYSGQLSHKINVFSNANTYISTPYVPEIEDFALDSLDLSKYKTDEIVKVLPPTAVPISTPDGTQIIPDGNGGWKDVVTGEPVVVPNEDELIVSDPIKTPDGIQVPGGDDIPEVPDTPQPTPDDTITEDDFENLSCAKPKKPDFKPVGESFTHAFPFSIPWDIKRYIDNAFGGIDDERPSFALTFLGDDVVIEIPAYFDKWVSFAKSLTIIVFDIGILFLFYRFMKGGGD